MKTDKPNFLIIMSDQHAQRVTGCYGDPVVKTPNIDRLSENGVTFDNAYCQFPLCVPSRSSFLTGLPPDKLNVWTNQHILSSAIPTFAHGLGRAGYDVDLAGRMHFVGADQRHGFHDRIIGEVNGEDLGELLMDTCGISVEGLKKSGPGSSAYIKYDEAVCKRAVEYIDQKGKGVDSDPFCLMVGLVLPHCPFVCPPKYFHDYYNNADFPSLPVTSNDLLHPENRRWMEQTSGEHVDENDIRRTRAAYYGLVSYFDSLIGTILDATEKNGLLENTVIIYVSDHGEMAGQHGLWWKWVLYEDSIKVPMIIHCPGKYKPQRIPQNVGLINIANTLLDMAGAQPLPHTSSASMVPLLEGDSGNWTNVVFSDSCGGHFSGIRRTVRKDQWKFTYYHGHEDELFNLDKDPDEQNNLVAHGNHKELEDELRTLVLDGWDPVAIQSGMAEADGRCTLIHSSPGGTSNLDAPGVVTNKFLQDMWSAPEGCNRLVAIKK